MPKLCLVTGGAGFIGSAASLKLAESFDRVVVVDSLLQQVHPSRQRPNNLSSDVELVVGDVSSPVLWDMLLPDFRPDTVIHLAAETGTGQSLREASRHAGANVVGTTQMLDAFVRFDLVPARFVLSSSRAVYGEGAWQKRSTGEIVYPGLRSKKNLEDKIWDFPGLDCIDFEASRIHSNPVSIYAATKLAQEHILQAWSSAYGSELFILRFQNVFGPGQSLHNPYTGIVQIFAQLARDGRSIPVYEDGKIVRDFVLVSDVVDAILIAANGLGQIGTFDIGSGQKTTILALATLISRKFGAVEPVITEQFRYGDVRHAACDITRTVREFGWRPKHSLEDGLSQLLQWMEESLV